MFILQWFDANGWVTATTIPTSLLLVTGLRCSNFRKWAG